MIRTVTCRQFPNLTFAPRKTCHSGQQPHASTLSMSQQGLVYTTGYAFAILFLEKLYFFAYNPFSIFFCGIFTSALFFHPPLYIEETLLFFMIAMIYIGQHYDNQPCQENIKYQLRHLFSQSHKYQQCHQRNHFQ